MIADMENGQGDKFENIYGLRTLPKEVGKLSSCHFHIFYIISGANLEISRLTKITFRD